MVYLRRRLRFRNTGSGTWVYLFEYGGTNTPRLGLNIDGYKSATWSARSLGLSNHRRPYGMSHRSAERLIAILLTQSTRKYEYQALRSI